MDIDQRFEQLERQTKRLRMAVVVLATALCGVVSMAATESTESEDGVFNTVRAKLIYVVSDKGDIAVAMHAATDGNGMVSTFSPTAKELVRLGATLDGGAVGVWNKTGDNIISLAPDDYGNGEVSVFNRKGEGRVWDSQ